MQGSLRSFHHCVGAAQHQQQQRNYYVAHYGLYETIPYHDRVLDHCDTPQNVGTLDKEAPDVGTALVGSPDGGEVIKL